VKKYSPGETIAFNANFFQMISFTIHDLFSETGKTRELEPYNDRYAMAQAKFSAYLALTFREEKKCLELKSYEIKVINEGRIWYFFIGPHNATITYSKKG